MNAGDPSYSASQISLNEQITYYGYSEICRILTLNIGPSAILNLDFPNNLFLQSRDLLNVGMLVETDRKLECDFLKRFRQNGGKDSINIIRTMPEEIVSSAAAAKKTLQKETVVILLPTDQITFSIIDACLLSGIHLIILTRDLSSLSFVGDEVYKKIFYLNFSSLLMVLISPKEQVSSVDHHEKHTSPSPNGGPPPGETIILPASRFVHDGGYSSEGDEEYSWLWTGPGTHFRFLVPYPHRSSIREVEIPIIRTERQINLDRLCVQINGIPRPFSIDRWSDNSGKITVELPPSDEYIVLTLIASELSEVDGRRIGFCLDKLIIKL